MDARIKEMDNDEYAIWKKMLRLEHIYFSDMRHEMLSLEKKYGNIRYKHDDIWLPGYENEIILENALIYREKWIIKKVKWLKTGVGMCEEKKKIVKITRRACENMLKMTLLHELIHIYEMFYERRKYLENYRQWLCIHLYEKLKKRIGEKTVEELIDIEMDYYICHQYRSIHSLLFLLKSIDLDIRLKKPLGTVYGYDRRGLFGKMTNNKHSMEVITA